MSGNAVLTEDVKNPSEKQYSEELLGPSQAVSLSDDPFATIISVIPPKNRVQPIDVSLLPSRPQPLDIMPVPVAQKEEEGDGLPSRSAEVETVTLE